MTRPVAKPSAEMRGIIESFAAGYRPGASVDAPAVYDVLVRESCPLHGFPALSARWTLFSGWSRPSGVPVPARGLTGGEQIMATEGFRVVTPTATAPWRAPSGTPPAAPQCCRTPSSAGFVDVVPLHRHVGQRHRPRGRPAHQLGLHHHRHRHRPPSGWWSGSRWMGMPPLLSLTSLVGGSDRSVPS